MTNSPPPIYQKKKSSFWKIALIVLASLTLICVAIGIISQSWAKTPEGQAAGTRAALTSTAKPTRPSIVYTVVNTSPLEGQEQNLPSISIITDTPSPTKTLQPTRTLTPTLLPSDIEYQEIIDFYEHATEIQWDEYKKGVDGKRVIWEGEVFEVTETLGSYSVWLCYDNYCFYKFWFNTKDKSYAMSLMKGDKLKVDGILDTGLIDFLNIIGLDVFLEDAVASGR